MMKSIQKLELQIKNSPNEILNSSNLITKVNCPNDDEIQILKDNTILIGMLNPFKNRGQIEKIINKKDKAFLIRTIT